MNSPGWMRSVPHTPTNTEDNLVHRFIEHAASLSAHVHSILAATEQLSSRLEQALRARAISTTPEDAVLVRAQLTTQEALRGLFELSIRQRPRDGRSRLSRPSAPPPRKRVVQNPPGGEDRHRLLAAVRAGGLSMEQLWLRYFALGGDVGRVEVEAYLSALMPLSALQHDMLAHAINERLDEIAPPRVPYAAEFSPPPDTKPSAFSDTCPDGDDPPEEGTTPVDGDDLRR